MLWLLENTEDMNALYSFLGYNPDEEKIEFGKEAIAALMNDGDVNYVDKIILDISFKNNPCLLGVYDEMIKNSTIANDYLNNFDTNMSVANLMFLGDNTVNSSINAFTTPPENYLIKITFNTNNLNRSKLSIGRTFIHELIHAEIFKKLLSLSNNSSINLTQSDLILVKDNFPGLFDYYVRYKFNVPSGQVLTEPQHQMMAQHYRGIISDAIKQFDNNQNPQEIYDSLAWIGLMGDGPINGTTGLTSNPTVAWQNLTPIERLSINNIITSFESNTANCQ